MVSKASDDLPDPLSPVITVRVLRGISTEMFFRLCWRAPRTVMLLMAMATGSKDLEQRADSPAAMNLHGGVGGRVANLYFRIIFVRGNSGQMTAPGSPRSSGSWLHHKLRDPGKFL